MTRLTNRWCCAQREGNVFVWVCGKEWREKEGYINSQQQRRESQEPRQPVRQTGSWLPQLLAAWWCHRRGGEKIARHILVRCALAKSPQGPSLFPTLPPTITTSARAGLQACSQTPKTQNASCELSAAAAPPPLPLQCQKCTKAGGERGGRLAWTTSRNTLAALFSLDNKGC